MTIIDKIVLLITGLIALYLVILFYRRYAKEKGLFLSEWPADWDKHGNSAGFRRNAEMAHFADACVCFWDGKSVGTKHMIETAKAKNLDVRVVKY